MQRRPAGPDKRRAVLDAAAEVFCREGYAGASIDAVAVEAGVSRQTIYNQIGDKEKLFKAVVADITERSSAAFFALLDTFPVAPENLEAELTTFARHLLDHFMCDRDGQALRTLIATESARYPELFATWREYGPGRKHPAMAARFAQLAHAGYLDLDDASLAARQFSALLLTDLRWNTQFGHTPTEAELQKTAADAVHTFVRAFGKR